MTAVSKKIVDDGWDTVDTISNYTGVRVYGYGTMGVCMGTLGMQMNVLLHISFVICMIPFLAVMEVLQVASTKDTLSEHSSSHPFKIVPWYDPFPGDHGGWLGHGGLDSQLHMCMHVCARAIAIWGMRGRGEIVAGICWMYDLHLQSHMCACENYC